MKQTEANVENVNTVFWMTLCWLEWVTSIPAILKNYCHNRNKEQTKQIKCQ
jgi:hypothetical protein